jgi:hypothetical protein
MMAKTMAYDVATLAVKAVPHRQWRDLRLTGPESLPLGDALDARDLEKSTSLTA